MRIPLIISLSDDSGANDTRPNGPDGVQPIPADGSGIPLIPMRICPETRTRKAVDSGRGQSLEWGSAGPFCRRFWAAN